MRCGTRDRCRQLMGVAKVGLASNSTGEALGQRRACAPGVGLTEPVRATHPGGGTLPGSRGTPVLLCDGQRGFPGSRTPCCCRSKFGVLVLEVSGCGVGAAGSCPALRRSQPRIRLPESAP